MKSFKIFFMCFLICVVLIYKPTVIEAATIENPLDITGYEEINTDTDSFDVTIRLKNPVTLGSYEIYVQYDPNVLKVDNSYFYTEEFKQHYANGFMLANKKSDGEIVFTGTKLGATAYTGDFAKVHFEIIKDADHNPVSTGTNLTIYTKSIGVENGSSVDKLTILNPKVKYTVLFGNQHLNHTLGDIDRDDTISLTDAQLTLKAALKIQFLDAEQMILGDVDFDGNVTLKDAQIILKTALHIGT